MAVSTTSIEIAGFADAPATGTMELVRWTRPDRIRRAWAGLGLCWALAVATVFIPVAHFLLVPGFAVAGPVVFVRRARRRAAIRRCHGRCPDCGAEQDFAMSGGPDGPLETRCASCHRGLTVRPAPGP